MCPVSRCTIRLLKIVRYNIDLTAKNVEENTFGVNLQTYTTAFLRQPCIIHFWVQNNRIRAKTIINK